MLESWAQIKRLQLGNDPIVFVTSAKAFIEQAFLSLLNSCGADVSHSVNALAAVEQHFDVLPDGFKAQKQPIFELLTELKNMDRQLDWYNGDFIDHKKIALEQEKNFATVLELLRPNR
jgi:hypothetical protein